MSEQFPEIGEVVYDLTELKGLQLQHPKSKTLINLLIQQNSAYKKTIAQLQYILSLYQNHIAKQMQTLQLTTRRVQTKTEQHLQRLRDDLKQIQVAIVDLKLSKIEEVPIFIDREVIVQKTIEVEKPILVQRIVQIEKPVQIPVEKQVIVQIEKIVYVECEVKPIFIEKIVEVQIQKPVYIQRVVQVQIPVVVQRTIQVQCSLCKNRN